MQFAFVAIREIKTHKKKRSYMMNNKKRTLKTLPNDRHDYSKKSGTLPLPFLAEIQLESFDWFRNIGLDEVFKEVFPVYNVRRDALIEYRGLRLENPERTPLECKERDFTYNASLRVKLALVLQKTGEMKETEVFMGDIPIMTPNGTFVVNGAERVIVSQLVRSPGAYMSKTFEKTGKFIYNADLIPTRGTWLEFETDQKDLMWVRIDRQRKLNATVLLKALGIEENKDFIKLFGDNTLLKNTLQKDQDIKTSRDALIEIFRKLKPGEPITNEGVKTFVIQKFFDQKRYDLGRAGRFKFNRKLGIYNRLVNRTLAENLVSSEGEILFTKGHLLSKEDVEMLKDKEVFENGAHTKNLNINRELDDNGIVNVVKVYVDDKKSATTNIIGTDLNQTISRVTIADIIAIFSYFVNVIDGIGNTDDIDHLGNRRIRSVGELIQTQFRIGLTKTVRTIQQKMSISDMETATIQSLINISPLTSSVREFFNSAQLSQFMDQTNPLAELANKRRLSALGPGGLSRDRASMDVRDVHHTHYGRICPIETPEGQNIGLINNLATYAKINRYGFIETPYRRVDKKTHQILNESDYLSADDERDYVIAHANINIDENNVILDDFVVARRDGENIMAPREDVDYIDVSPKQIVSIAASCIPFLENDDPTRALMGANMQRQALPLLKPAAPYVGTGMEHIIARDSGLAVLSTIKGEVTYVDSRMIIARDEKGKNTKYDLQKFARSNQGTCINQKAIVKVGQKIEIGDILADGPAMDNGDLALGQNVTVAFMTWSGYNYEDAVIMSERLVKEDIYTSIHIEKYEVESRDTKLGAEEITRDIPNVSEEAKAYLDEHGIIVPGAEVKEGDILVGKTTPKGVTEPTPEEKLLMAIFSDKTKEGKDTSLRVAHGGAGIVLDVIVFSRKKGDDLPAGVNQVVRVYIVQKRKISEGDKMSGRHGNKGVISRILPVEDMPFLPDGTPIDIMLNPLGVPSRMNIGQILEMHLGLACEKLGFKLATPVFDGITNEEIFELMEEAKLDIDGKSILYDGRTGERFDERISVGSMYLIKLVHMVDDKLHARATGPYSLVTQQPLGGKAQNGGQRFGEMEVWALEAYGAAHTLQELLTIKSDDRVGRRKTYEAIIKGYEIPQPGMPEAFKVLTKELQSLGMDVRLLDTEGVQIDMEALARETQAEERKINSTIRSLTRDGGANLPDESDDLHEYLN